MEARDVALLVQQQLDTMDAATRLAIEANLIAPVCVRREWDYPGPGYSTAYDCWTIWQGQHNVDIAYCQGGFGPRASWGLVWRDANASIGPDSSWFSTLAAVFADA